jgi:hypothetical protein
VSTEPIHPVSARASSQPQRAAASRMRWSGH